MEIKMNIPDWLKIPINVLLPSTFLFSGIILLLPNDILSKLYLLDWKNEQGFYIGLSFLISSCLLLVYLVYFLKSVVASLFYKLTIKRKTIINISQMSDVEQAIIYRLYHSPGYTYELDFNQPLIKGMLSRNFIYMGGEQQVTYDPFVNSIPVKFTLQPFVYQTLDYYKPKIEKYIRNLEQKLDNTTNVTKKEKLKTKLSNVKDRYSCMYIKDYF